MFFVFLVDLSKATLRCYTSICDGNFFYGNCDKYELLYKQKIKSVFRAALAAGGQIVKMSKYYLAQTTGNI